jgi:hypothetical protein
VSRLPARGTLHIVKLLDAVSLPVLRVATSETAERKTLQIQPTGRSLPVSAGGPALAPCPARDLLLVHLLTRPDCVCFFFLSVLPLHIVQMTYVLTVGDGVLHLGQRGLHVPRVQYYKLSDLGSTSAHICISASRGLKCSSFADWPFELFVRTFECKHFELYFHVVLL